MQLASILLLSTISASAVPDNIVLEFTADWCLGCQQISPMVSALQRKGYPIRSVDADREPQLLERFGVKLLPTFVLVVNGKEVDRIVDGISEQKLRQFSLRVPKRSPSRASSVNAKVTRTKSEQPSNSKRSLAGSIVAKTKQALTPRIKLPLFGRKQDDPAVSRAIPPIVRAQLGEVQPQRRVDPVRYTARLKVEEESGVNFGSGTIIDSRPGRSLVLTCGHIFREISDNANVEVDIFQGSQTHTYKGEIVRYDLKSDIGLVAIPTEMELPVSNIAPIAAAPRKGAHVFSVGCSNGDNPTKLQLRVTTLNRYLGPDNIECTGIPVQGRSGGGLFNLDGQVIGICVAADPKDSRGLYTGLEPIRNFLDVCGLSHLLDTARPGTSTPNLLVDESLASARANELDIPPRPPAAAEFPTKAAISPALKLSATNANLNPTTQAALQQAGEAEIVCIIRPLDKSRDASRVVIINRASEKFVASLTREIRSQTQLTSASFRATNNARHQQLKTAHSVPNREVLDLDALTARRASRWRQAHTDSIGPTVAIENSADPSDLVAAGQSQSLAKRYRRK